MEHLELIVAQLADVPCTRGVGKLGLSNTCFERDAKRLEKDKFAALSLAKLRDFRHKSLCPGCRAYWAARLLKAEVAELGIFDLSVPELTQGGE